jgi:hypothetical protein
MGTWTVDGAKLRTPRISLTVEQDNLEIESVVGQVTILVARAVFVSSAKGKSTIWQKTQVIDRLMTSFMTLQRFLLQ